MTRIDKEKEMVYIMIRLYCYKKHGENYNLCKECSGLLKYCHESLFNCKLGEKKSSCRACTIRCYREDMRTKIREVMRYSGPRLLIYRPLEVIKHLVS
jgi:hypothetical protein